jgi:hypothetical protein
MGECLSKPLDKELYQHMLEYNHKNSHEFLSYPSLQLNLKSPISKQANLELEYEKLSEFYTKTQYQYESSTHGISSSPYLLIEIQKGHHFYLYESWSNITLPYIKLTLLPSNTTVITSKTSIYFTNWYELFSFPEISDTSLRVTGYVSRLFGSDIEVGSWEYNISNLKNQEVSEKWCKLTSSRSKDNLIPKLRIRMQLLHDQKQRLKDILNLTSEHMQRIKEDIEKSY